MNHNRTQESGSIIILENVLLKPSPDQPAKRKSVFEEPRPLSSYTSAATSSIASTSGNQQIHYYITNEIPREKPHKPDLDDIIAILREKQSQRFRGGRGNNSQDQYIKLRLDNVEQRVQNLQTAINSDMHSANTYKYVVQIKYDIDIHKFTMKDYLSELSIGINFDDEDEIRRYWCTIYMHMIEIIFERICDCQRLTDKSNEFMVNTPMGKQILIYSLYNNLYDSFDFISLALFGKTKIKSNISNISRANILVKINTDDNHSKIKVEFYEKECHYETFYSIMEGQLNNLLTVFWKRLDQYYILMEMKEILVIDQLPDVNKVYLLGDVLQIVAKRSRISYIIDEKILKCFTNYLKKFDNLIDYDAKKNEINLILIRVISRVIVDILTKIYSFNLSSNLFDLSEYINANDALFTYSATGVYDLLHRRGCQRVGPNNCGEYSKQLKVTRAMLNNKDSKPKILETPLRIVLNCRYDTNAPSLMEIDCYNLNVRQKYDKFQSFCNDFQLRIKRLIDDFVDRLDRNYIVLNENFNMLPFTNNKE
jgi:hypothetical protein